MRGKRCSIASRPGAVAACARDRHRADGPGRRPRPRGEPRASGRRAARFPRFVERVLNEHPGATAPEVAGHAVTPVERSVKLASDPCRTAQRRQAGPVRIGKRALGAGGFRSARRGTRAGGLARSLSGHRSGRGRDAGRRARRRRRLRRWFWRKGREDPRPEPLKPRSDRRRTASHFDAAVMASVQPVRDRHADGRLRSR